MNEHSSRLLERIFNAIDDFLVDKIDSLYLFNIVEGNVNAMEENGPKVMLEHFLVVINDSIYLYDEGEGKKYLKTEYEKLKIELHH